MSGVGGYVRRCERVQGTILHIRQNPWPFIEGFMWQSMPPLRFEQFAVEDDIKPVDMNVLETVRSWYAEHPK